ncbi:MAG: type II toxin-antitoxin system PemK/MazF family toxin [Clostridium sp.]|nr:type II toxin-antitoxin system PemK/MazF family toxin [Clostridium sp.]MCM1208326.1 type II toxin-antitoxin system PemK/MazF family toxin [Ruminococcus sp.]
MKEIMRGDIVYVDLGQHPKSSVQSGLRPCIVVSNDRNNKCSTVVNVCPFSGKQDKKFIPVHVQVTPNDVDGFLDMVSVCMPEQIATVDKSKIIRKAGHIDGNSDIMRRLEKAIMRQFGINKETNICMIKESAETD